MILQNLSNNPITLAGIYTIPAGVNLTVPFNAVQDDTSLVGYVDNQQLRVVSAEESFTLRTLPSFTQGVIVTAQSLTPGQTYSPTVVGSSTNLQCLWLAPFQYCRLYLNVTSGDIEVTLQDSPDGGVTFYPASDLPTLSATYTTTGTGKTSSVLPSGLCLISFIMKSTNGGTGVISYSRQS